MSKVTQYRLMVTSRILAAVIGGYALTSGLAVFMALLLPVSKSEATQASTMLSFIIYAVIVLWIFAARSMTRVWITLLATSLPLWLLCWWLMPGGVA